MSEFDSLKLENQICFPLYVCSKEIVNKYKPFLDEINLTYTQYITMMVLWEKEELTVSELGKKLFLDSGTLTPLLKKLEAKGLVTRNRSKDDERNLLVKLTPSGEKLKKQATTIPTKLASCVDLEPNEAILLKQLLTKMLKSFDK